MPKRPSLPKSSRLDDAELEHVVGGMGDPTLLKDSDHLDEAEKLQAAIAALDPAGLADDAMMAKTSEAADMHLGAYAAKSGAHTENHVYVDDQGRQVLEVKSFDDQNHLTSEIKKISYAGGGATEQTTYNPKDGTYKTDYVEVKLDGSERYEKHIEGKVGGSSYVIEDRTYKNAAGQPVTEHIVTELDAEGNVLSRAVTGGEPAPEPAAPTHHSHIEILNYTDEFGRAVTEHKEYNDLNELVSSRRDFEFAGGYATEKTFFEKDGSAETSYVEYNDAGAELYSKVTTQNADGSKHVVADGRPYGAGEGVIHVHEVADYDAKGNLVLHEEDRTTASGIHEIVRDTHQADGTVSHTFEKRDGNGEWLEQVSETTRPDGTQHKSHRTWNSEPGVRSTEHTWDYNPVTREFKEAMHTRFADPGREHYFLLKDGQKVEVEIHYDTQLHAKVSTTTVSVALQRGVPDSELRTVQVIDSVTYEGGATERVTQDLDANGHVTSKLTEHREGSFEDQVVYEIRERFDADGKPLEKIVTNHHSLGYTEEKTTYVTYHRATGELRHEAITERTLHGDIPAPPDFKPGKTIVRQEQSKNGNWGTETLEFDAKGMMLTQKIVTTWTSVENGRQAEHVRTYFLDEKKQLSHQEEVTYLDAKDGQTHQEIRTLDFEGRVQSVHHFTVTRTVAEDGTITELTRDEAGATTHRVVTQENGTILEEWPDKGLSTLTLATGETQVTLKSANGNDVLVSRYNPAGVYIGGTHQNISDDGKTVLTETYHPAGHRELTIVTRDGDTITSVTQSEINHDGTVLRVQKTDNLSIKDPAAFISPDDLTGYLYFIAKQNGNTELVTTIGPVSASMSDFDWTKVHIDLDANPLKDIGSELETILSGKGGPENYAKLSFVLVQMAQNAKGNPEAMAAYMAFSAVDMAFASTPYAQQWLQVKHELNKVVDSSFSGPMAFVDSITGGKVGEWMDEAGLGGLHDALIQDHKYAVFPPAYAVKVIYDLLPGNIQSAIMDGLREVPGFSTVEDLAGMAIDKAKEGLNYATNLVREGLTYALQVDTYKAIGQAYVEIGNEIGGAFATAGREAVNVTVEAAKAIEHALVDGANAVADVAESVSKAIADGIASAAEEAWNAMKKLWPW